MSDEKDHTLSISVVCFDSADEDLQKLVYSIIESVSFLKSSCSVSPIKLFLIDNSIQADLSLEIFDEVRSQLNELEIELCLLQGHGNVGYGAGQNIAIRGLLSQFHLLLNPDVQLDPHCLKTAIDYLSSNEEAVLLSPFAEYGNGQKQYLCKRYPSVLTFLIRGFFPSPLRKLFAERLARFEMRDLSESRPTGNIPIASGCFMFCRTSALREVGGFDERYFLYFEDFDLSLRIGKLGSLAYVPQMRIQHAGGHAARKGASHLWMFAKSGFRFFNTHGWRFIGQSG